MKEYTLIETLQDGAAPLYRGLRARDGRPVIIRAQRSSDLSSSVGAQRLLHDYQVRRMLGGPHVAQAYALEQFQGEPALIMEDCQGQLLARLMGKPMEPGLFLRLALQLADALASVHAQDIIHRNLTPQGIIIDPKAGQVRLIDFRLASLLPREHQPASPPGLLEGSLAYLSPEQTGRMNRSVDARSDLYSLGIIFYEMLAGRHPFHQAQDPLEWVHCHVARTPRPLAEFVPELPQPLSDIILKLLAKAPEDRYQSALGLRYDLQHCLEQWGSTGRIKPFELATHDVPDRLRIPQKLYGRQAEVEELMGAFERAATGGAPELVLVSGYSGIGKTSLVHELHKPLVRERGRLLEGKFDQYKRDIPYSTLVQAFRSLVQELLTESEEQVRRWRERLQAALGANGQLIIDVIPQAQLLLGPQPPVPELPLAEAESRFQRVFHQFVCAFCHPMHPLVLFLDDLQWADTASLRLLQHILTHPDTRHLLVIGAYRDNEVGPTHPLLSAVEEVRKAGVSLPHLILSPLALEHLVQLVSDALRCRPEQAQPLAQLVHERTSGNPFFALQFLTVLYEEHLIEFDQATATWQWDLPRIRARRLADNVVDLMVSKLRRLPASTQEALKLAACAGNSMDAHTLSVIQGCTEEELHQNLWVAVREGLLLRQEGTYKFLHDRVQQAAWSLIPEEERAALHLRIGRLLLASTPPEQLHERLFDIVNQLNRGAALLLEPAERLRLAELNLAAGRKAKGSTAYASAASYLAAGMELLPPNPWVPHYELTRDLYLERAQCEYLCSRFQEAEALFDPLMRHAHSRTDAANICSARLYLYLLQGQNERAVASGLECLRLFDIHLTPHPSREQAQEQFEKVWLALRGLPIEDLLELPAMADPEAHALLKLVESLFIPAMYTDFQLTCIALCHGVRLCLEHGNAELSCIVYVFFGMVLCGGFGKYQEAYRFGKVGYDLAETRRDMAVLKGRTLVNFSSVINLWTHSLDSSLELLRRGFEACNEVGDLTNACYACNQQVAYLLIKGEPLEVVHRESERLLGFVRQARFKAPENVILPFQRLVQALRGQTSHLAVMDGEGFEERAFEELLTRDINRLVECWYHIRRIQCRFMAGDVEEALRSVTRAREILWASFSTIDLVEYHYHASLVLASRYEALGRAQQEECLQQLRDSEVRLREWAAVNPGSFLAKSALVSAEVARLGGRLEEAARLYEQAIRTAREGGFIQGQGLAYELASGFYQRQGLEAMALALLREARTCYVRWGAEGKVRQLEQRYPQLQLQDRQEERPAAPRPQAEPLELLSVVKASQSISGEILLPQLQQKLLKLVCEYAGAQRGCLLLPQGSSFLLHAQAAASLEGLQVRILSPAQIATSATLPLSLLHYVSRTHGKAILDEATRDPLFSGDDYIARARPRSVLCMPILRQGQVVGLLYLENNLLSGAFTPERLTALELLAAQAAISLESAALYAALHDNQQQLQAIIDNTTALVSIKDTGGRYLLVNRQYERLFHASREWLAGRVDEDLFPREVAALLRQHDLEVLEQGSPREYEEVLPQDSGARTYLSTKFLLRESLGRSSGVCSISTDITERKRAEQSERFLAEASRKLFTSLDYAVTLRTVAELALPELADGCILYLLLEDGTLQPVASAVNPSMGVAPPPVQGGAVRPHTLQAFTLERPEFGRVEEAPHVAGAPEYEALIHMLQARSYLRVPLLARGRCRGLLALVSARHTYDSTLLPLAEEMGHRAALAIDNARLYRQAQEAILLRDDFLSVASHELRTPLTPLQLQLQLMQQALHKAASPETLSRMLAVGLRQVERLKQLVEDLLDTTQITSGRLKLHPEVLDLAELVRDVVTRFTLLLERSGSRLELRLQDAVTGYWDRRRMDQVVVNLLTNAIKFGRGRPIEIAVEGGSQLARLLVRDQGIGIPAEHQGQIFGRFERVVSSRSYGGLGLGLYITREILEAHGGAVHVQSEPESGSTFVVELPRRLPDA